MIIYIIAKVSHNIYLILFFFVLENYKKPKEYNLFSCGIPNNQNQNNNSPNHIDNNEIVLNNKRRKLN